MRCIRAQNISVLPLLEPKLLRHSDYSHEAFVALLYIALKENNPRLCIYILLDDDETELIGFTITEAPVGQSFVFSHQTWVDAKKAGKAGSDLLFSRVVEWTKHINRSAIRAETKRSAKALERQRNIRAISTLIEYSVYDSAEFLTQESEQQHGRRINEQRTERGTEEHGSSAEQVSNGEGIGESGGIWPAGQGSEPVANGGQRDETASA